MRQQRIPTDLERKLLDACRAQHNAIDMLFAMLVAQGKFHDMTFMPSKSGPPWDAVVQGNRAIEEAERLLGLGP